MKREQAETVALRALAWLAANEDLCRVFLGTTGASLEDFRKLATEPEFLVSVLEFLTMDDAWIIECCDDLGLDYTAMMQARQVLPGGAQMHWI